MKKEYAWQQLRRASCSAFTLCMLNQWPGFPSGKTFSAAFSICSEFTCICENEWSAEPSSRVRAPIFDKNYFLVLGCFIGALLAKPMAVTFPVVLLLLDFYPLNRFSSPGSLKKIVLEKTPFLLLSLMLVDSNDFCATLRECDSVVAVRIFFFPGVDCCPCFLFISPEDDFAGSFGPALSLSAGCPLIYGAFLAIDFLHTCHCSQLFVSDGRWRKAWSALWAYYAITILPVIGLIQVGFQSMADRYTYLPSLGPVCVNGALCGMDISQDESYCFGFQGKNCWPACARSAAVAILLILSHLTLTQIAIWKDSLTLWNYELSAEPDGNPVAYYHRGIAYQTNERYAEAIRDYSKAISINPGYYEAYNNRATVYDALDQPEPAIRDYTRSLALEAAFQDLLQPRHELCAGRSVRERDRRFHPFPVIDPRIMRGHTSIGVLHTLNIGDRQRARLDFEKGCVLGNETGCNRLNELTRNTERPGVK